MEKREDRRDRTLRYATRAWKVWAAKKAQPSLQDYDKAGAVKIPVPDARFGIGHYRKGKAIGCDCRGRKHGQPKRGSGCCHGDWRPSARERTLNRRLCRKWVDALRNQEPEDVQL